MHIYIYTYIHIRPAEGAAVAEARPLPQPRRLVADAGVAEVPEVRDPGGAVYYIVL